MSVDPSSDSPPQPDSIPEPAGMDYAELQRYASARGVEWRGFWALAPCRKRQRRIWRTMYPEEREFVRRYFPAWFAEQKFSIRNATISKRSRNFHGNNIVMAPSKYMNQGFHGGLSPIADKATFGHELLHALDRQVGGRLRIWRSYADRQARNPNTGKIDEDAYYEYDDSIVDPAQMLGQFMGLNPEAQAELFEAGVRWDLAYRAALEAADAPGLAEASAQRAPYVAVLEFVQSLSRDGSLQSR